MGGARHAARAAPGSRSPPWSALYVPVASWWSNVEHRADPRELLVSTQSSEEVKRVADEVRAMARKKPKLSVTVDSADGATFP